MTFQRTAIKGFSLTELMSMMAIFAIVITLSFSNIHEWINKAKIRASADVLQNGARFAQSETNEHNRLIESLWINSTTSHAADSLAVHDKMTKKSASQILSKEVKDFLFHAHQSKRARKG